MLFSGLAADAEISSAHERDGGRAQLRTEEFVIGPWYLPTNDFALCARVGHNSVHPPLRQSAYHFSFFFSHPVLRPGNPLLFKAGITVCVQGKVCV